MENNFLFSISAKETRTDTCIIMISLKKSSLHEGYEIIEEEDFDEAEDYIKLNTENNLVLSLIIFNLKILILIEKCLEIPLKIKHITLPRSRST